MPGLGHRRPGHADGAGTSVRTGDSAQNANPRAGRCPRPETADAAAAGTAITQTVDPGSDIAQTVFQSPQASGLIALTVVPWAPNFTAFRRASSNFERA